MNIAVLASEAAPFAKSGGLGDVIRALPAALQAIPGNRVVVFLPYYKTIRENPAWKTKLVTQFTVTLGWRQNYAGVLLLTRKTAGVQVYFIDNLQYFGHREGLYGHGDDAERFAFFSKACLEALKAVDFIPDVIQCNDWQTGLVPVLLKQSEGFGKTKSVFTIHNAQYQGQINSTFFDNVLALPPAWRPVLDWNGGVNFMKAGILAADAVTTVSETYAKELLCSAHGCGLETIFREHAHKLTGITNGVDTRLFDPATDPALPANYSPASFLENKARCKAFLQQALGLRVDPARPLLVMVTRLVEHKGLDLLCAIAHRLLREHGVQLAVLGTGEERYERFLKALAAEFPGQMVAKITFDESLASRFYAGGDIFLMPSRSEPCGLSQINAMRYGTVPVVHAVGGLKDTVPGVDDQGNGGLGFTFQNYETKDFYNALGRCLTLYNNQPKFNALQKCCMSQDFSWTTPAEKYMNLFSKF